MLQLTLQMSAEFFPELTPKENDHTPNGIFRVGNPDVTEEIIDSGGRVLRWNPGAHDFNPYLKRLAKRDLLVERVEGDGRAVMTIPPGSRSAESFLAGFEAWSGEKTKLLDFVADYQNGVRKLFKDHFDSSVTLRSVAATRAGEFFVLPPHKIDPREQGFDIWRSSMENAAKTALANSTNIEPVDKIVADFSARLDGQQ